MSKHKVTRACGHEEIHFLYGNMRERDNKIKWMEGTVCKSCYAKEREKERKEGDLSIRLKRDFYFHQVLEEAYHRLEGVPDGEEVRGSLGRLLKMGEPIEMTPIIKAIMWLGHQHYEAEKAEKTSG